MRTSSEPQRSRGFPRTWTYTESNTGTFCRSGEETSFPGRPCGTLVMGPCSTSFPDRWQPGNGEQEPECLQAFWVIQRQT